MIGGELQERLIPVPYSKTSTDQAVRFEFTRGEPVSLTLFVYLTTFMLTFYVFLYVQMFNTVLCLYLYLQLSVLYPTVRVCCRSVDCALRHTYILLVCSFYTIPAYNTRIPI